MTKWRLGMVFSGLFTITAVMFASVWAATNVSLANTGTTSVPFGVPYECKNGGFFIVYSFTGTTNDNDATNPNQDFVAFIAKDANGVPLYATIDHIGLSQTQNGSPTWPLGLYGGAINDITARPVTVTMYDISFGTATVSGVNQQGLHNLIANSGSPVLAEITFDVYIDNPPNFFYPDFCSEIPYLEPAVNPNRPINPSCPGDGSLNICIAAPNNGGEPDGIHVSAVNEIGESYEALYVADEVLVELPDNPTTNIEVASNPDAKISFYKLTTGEYQINIGPDSEGKVQVIIFTGIPPTNVYRRDFNIYDIIGN